MSPNITIIDRVVLRLKEQPLGDLITEEDLHDIVKEAVPKAFFEPTLVKNERYGATQHDRVGDPVIVQILKDVLKPTAEKLVREWLETNNDTLLGMWKKVFDAGIEKYYRDIQNEITTASLKKVLNSMIIDHNAKANLTGLPPIQLLI